MQSSNLAITITSYKWDITNPPNNPTYDASKAAVMNLAGQMSLDLRNMVIWVYFLVPGWAFAEGSVSKSGAEKSVAA
ncbi:short chain dehydrogenase/reductase [Colletotrichum graminicola M1.001]|uniref:Short chain dehydrogenase/reductase n=1 Tax=Colletotrichum graminicola (strain M1.001 / M2 / FGSC 10212) TaxID=645133 RepID=E3QMR6_COLGM|nr:short chain dehydrogenase/reductase [Colletotrichum graminicola M1.001]EFQ32154.1 short chain dehydrogenase/reductase [Colletotrichum graminicola M1.001]